MIAFGDRITIGVSTFGCDSGRSGIGNYARNVLSQFGHACAAAELELLASHQDRGIFGRPEDTRVVPNQCASPPINLLWHATALPVIERRSSWDVLFLPAANRRVATGTRCPRVGTVHDLAPLRLSGKYDGLRTAYLRHVIPRLVRGLDRIIAVSESGKRDIIEFTGLSEERISVIPNGLDHERFRPVPLERARTIAHSFIGSPAPYLVYVSRLEHPGKNHVRLIRAFEALKADRNLPHHLVVVGPDWSRADVIHERIGRSHLADQIHALGHVPLEVLPALYTAADVSVFPSLYEGFGLPVLEAMACGTPVACSTAGSIPEVAGDAAVFFDPCDTDDISFTLAKLLDDHDMRTSLSRRGLDHSRRFTWRSTAQQTLHVLRCAAGSPR